MDAVIAQFDERVQEVDQYLALLGRLEEPGVVLLQPSKRTHRRRRFDPTSLHVMRASALLMIYNLVESSIRSSLEAIYEAIKTDGRALREIRDELRTIWVEQHVRKLEQPSATRKTYSKVARELADEILADAVVKLQAGKAPMSGNLDAERIRQVCHSHGVPSYAHHRAYGGAELKTVKDQRNALAHGEVSFSECGQQYPVADLERIKKQVVIFIRSILKNVKRYVDERQYAA